MNNISQISGPVPNGPVVLTSQHYDSWAKDMTACMLAVQADILLRENARSNPPRFTTKRLNKLCAALNDAGYNGPSFTLESKDGYADLRDVLFADDLAERWGRGMGVVVLRDDENLFVGSQRHVTFGASSAGLLVPRGFPTRIEAVLYAIGKHPEAFTAHYPGLISDYIAKETFVAAQRAERSKKVPLLAQEHINLKMQGNAPDGKINATGVARLFEAMKNLCKENGVTEPEILKAIEGGIEFGKSIETDLLNIGLKMAKWPSIDPAYIDVLMKKIYPRLNEELRAQMTELFGSIENGFDPYGGGLPPGANPTDETGDDWPKPSQT